MNQTNIVDVKAWIDARPISRFQWHVLLLCFLIIMLDGYDAAVMGFIAPALIEDWGISRAQLGPILGAAMFGVAIGALVAGPLLDLTAHYDRPVPGHSSIFLVLALPACLAGIAILRSDVMRAMAGTTLAASRQSRCAAAS